MRRPDLDTIRAAAVLGVLAFHVQTTHHAPLGAGAGWAGVEVFFVLSGFLVAQSAARRTPERFYLRRAARILPVLAIVALVNGNPGALVGLDLIQRITTDTIENPDTIHLWSVQVELLAYLLTPFLIRQPAFLLAFIGAAGGMLAAAFPTDVGPGLLLRGSAFLLGLSLPLGNWIEPIPDFFQGSAAIFDRFTYAPVWAAMPLLAFPYSPGAAATFITVLAIAYPPRVLTWLGSTRLVYWVASRCFGLYMYQLAVLTLPVPLPVALVLLVALTELSYRYLELPVIAWSKRPAASGALA